LLFIPPNDTFDFVLNTEVARECKKKQLLKSPRGQDTPQSRRAVRIESSRVVTGERILLLGM